MAHKKNQGFTLIEVLIVTLLLFFLAIATFYSVRSTVEVKEIVDQKTELLQESRAILSLLERDVRLAFFVTAEDFLWKPITKPANPEDPPLPPPPKPLPVTIFVGKPEELFFSSRSHQKMSSDSPENEQHFITYQLLSGKLVRAESARAVSLKDRESPANFRSQEVMENIQKLKFSFWDGRRSSWVETWDTERVDNQNILPLAVKVELEYKPTPRDPADIDKVESIRISTAIRITEAAFKFPRTPDAPESPAL